VRRFDAEHGIVTEAWAPIARGRVLDDPVITGDRRSGSAGRRRRSTLRWRSSAVTWSFPKSVTAQPDRGELRGLFDFELADDEMAEITALDRHERTGPDPDIDEPGLSQPVRTGSCSSTCQGPGTLAVRAYSSRFVAGRTGSRWPRSTGPASGSSASRRPSAAVHDRGGQLDRAAGR
jgi:hypothetical protein